MNSEFEKRYITPGNVLRLRNYREHSVIEFEKIFNDYMNGAATIEDVLDASPIPTEEDLLYLEKKCREEDSVDDPIGRVKVVLFTILFWTGVIGIIISLWEYLA